VKLHQRRVVAIAVAILGLGQTACNFVIEPAPSSGSPAEPDDPDRADPPAGPRVAAEAPLGPDALPAAPPLVASTPVAAIALGATHACALSELGQVVCWGANQSGQLGYGHPWAIGDDEPPLDAGVVEVGGEVIGLTAGGRHTCALLADNRIRCWGYGDDLALGRGDHHAETIGDDDTPAEGGDAIIYASSPFAQIVAGQSHTCMLSDTGVVKCWGSSLEGALGYGHATKTGGWLGNVQVGGPPVVALEAGSDHTCAILTGGAVHCWGQAEGLGYDGLEDIGDDETPDKLGDLSLGEPIVALAAGSKHTCALTAEGAVRCWGVGAYGALGYGETRAVVSAATAGVVQVGAIVVSIVAGQRHTCALTIEGSVRCWGDGAHGALGHGDTQTIGDDEVPAVAGDLALDEDAVQIDAGQAYTCALLESGAVRCWGSGADGRTGLGMVQDVGDDEVPIAVEPVQVFGP
jgi:alpha-tubulin suppressor-like RCC1 family protein